MTTSKPGSSQSVKPEALLYWLADLCASEQGYGEWIRLATEEREQWLDDEGYSYTELKQAFHSFAAASAVDPVVADAVNRFLHQGEAIPASLLPTLGALVQEHLAAVDAIAGGMMSMRTLKRGLLLRKFETLGAYNAAAATKLGRYVEIGGSIETKIHNSLLYQVDEKESKINNLKDNKEPQAKSVEHKGTTRSKNEKSKFITQQQENALQTEKLIGAETRGTPGRGGCEHQGVGKQILQIDKQYYKQNYQAEVKAGLIVKPSYISDGSGSSRSVSITFDWQGDRGTVLLNKTTGAAELDPALTVVNDFTARALWNAHRKQQAAEWTATWDQHVNNWNARCALNAKTGESSQAMTRFKHVFPKAKVPLTVKQLRSERQDLTNTFEAKRRSAKRHDVTLVSLQRKRDEKKIQKLEPQQNCHERLNHSAAIAEAKTADKNHTELQKLYTDFTMTDVTMADIEMDRRIEAKITSQYGSLRAQKTIIRQTYHDLKAIQTGINNSVKRLTTIKQHIGGGQQHPKLNFDCFQLLKGVKIDDKDKYIVAMSKTTSPYTIQKNSNGKGFHLVASSYRNDYWQNLSQKNQYKAFNPAYNSEKSFHTTERTAYLAGKGAYSDLLGEGATKKTARLGASAVYFAALLEEDKRQLKYANSADKLAYAPFIFHRQLRVAKEVVHLNRHHFAWKLRLAIKLKIGQFIYNKMTKEDNYMKNNKFTGFHPFHRIARKTVSWTKTIWHYTLGPIYKHEFKWFNHTLSFISPKAGSWMAGAERKTANSVLFIGWHAIKGLWHLPEHLYHHTVYFGKQLLFALTHPWEYRKIWSGLKKDFKGIYHLLRFVYRDMVWAMSVYARTIYQVFRLQCGYSTNWKSVFLGAYHKKLYKKVRMIGEAWKFAGLAALVGKTAATRTAIQIEVLRMHLRRDLHRTGFLTSPIQHFISNYSKFLTKQYDSVKPAQLDNLSSKIEIAHQDIKSHWKKLILDYRKYKTNTNYKASVNYRINAFTSQLKPQVHTYLHSGIHAILDKVSKLSHKSKKIKKWTLSQYDLDLSQYLELRKAYKGLGVLGKKEVAVSFLALKDATKASKQGTIKLGMQNLNNNAKLVLSRLGAFKKDYSTAVTTDWNNVGEWMGVKLMNALLFSINSKSGQSEVKSLIKSNKLGKHAFTDIIGGFEVNHYYQEIKKDSGLVTISRNVRSNLESKFKEVDTIVSQPLVNKVLKHWLKDNQKSLITKDYLKVKTYHQTLKKKIHKYERIEKIGHTEVTESDLSTLSTLQKNKLLGQSFATLVGHTGKWKSLTLAQQAEYRSQFDSWISYNQNTNHALKRIKNTAKTKDANEVKEWNSEKSNIETGKQVVSVGSIVLNVKTNNIGHHSTWDTIPKPSMSILNQRQTLSNVRATLTNIAQDPHLLSISFAAHGSSSSNSAITPHNPSLFAYIMQIKHWSHKISEKIKKSKETKEKAAEEAKKAKEKEADAKKDVAKDEEMVKDGETTEKDLGNKALSKDSAINDKLEGNKFTDKGMEKFDVKAEPKGKELVNEEKDDEINITNKEFERGKTREMENLDDDARTKLMEDKKLDDVDEALHDGRKLETDVADKELETEADDLADREVKRIVDEDLRQGFLDTASEAESEAISDVVSGSTEAEVELDAAAEAEIEGMEVAAEDAEVVIELA